MSAREEKVQEEACYPEEIEAPQRTETQPLETAEPAVEAAAAAAEAVAAETADADENAEAQDAEERLAQARAKAAAAKVAAEQRRASRRSMDSASAFSDADQKPSAAARRGSIRSVLQSIEEAEKELKELDTREQDMDERLQLYSDVIGLRKELQVVRGDAERASTQLQMANDLVENQDPTVERDVALLEEEAQRSTIQQVWTSECQRSPGTNTDDDTSSWLKVSVENMPERLRVASEKFRAADKKAAELYSSQEKHINTNTDDRDKTKQKMRESVEGELKQLAETRARLKQVDNEQWHHIRRGTHVKERQMPRQRRQDAISQRVYVDESKAFGAMAELETERRELTEDVKQSKRALEDHMRSSEEVKRELKEQLRVAEENGKEARELREFFEHESGDLKALKLDLQRVLQYVRVRNREGTD